MWLMFAFGSALFAGVTSILVKCGVRQTDSTVATAIRTVIVLMFAWLIVWLTGAQTQLADIPAETGLFLILSGLATGLSWLCYFKALQLGDINKVVPVDKSSTILTILLAFVLLGEEISLTKLLCVFLIGAGIYLMIEKKDVGTPKKEGAGWFFYGMGSAVFASLTSVLGKIGISGVDANLGTAIRTTVVLIMAWFMVAVEKKTVQVKGISKKELFFICLSGLATGGSWLCYYRALQDGPASVVVPVDKLSLLVTVVFSYVAFGERLSRKAGAGLCLLTAGTLLMIAA